MNIRLRWLLPVFLSAATLLGGCAAPAVQSPRPLFRDSAFARPERPVQLQQALALSPAMQEFIDTEMATHIRSKGVRSGLMDALYTKGWLQLDYDAEQTRTAAEAFAARRGNCLSLVLMTASFARHFGLPVRFNSVYLEEAWTRSGGVFFVTGHVNISLGRGVTPTDVLLQAPADLLTIDFLPPQMLKGQRSHAVEESTVLAMFANNRAAEALTDGHLDEAYWWARAGMESDPRWLASYNTLAIVYRRKGMTDMAEQVLRTVLAREPENAQALSNLVLVLTDAGQLAQARVAAAQLALVQPVPPYAYFDRGVEAMRQGEYGSARELFRKEVFRAAYVPEFHFWLALANYGLGDLAGARGEIAKALENAATPRERDRYGAKLAWLNEQRRAGMLPVRSVSPGY